MHHECIAVFSHQRIDFLIVAGSSQCGDDKRLRFAPCKKRGTVCPRQNACTNRDRTNCTGIASINTRFSIQNLRTDNAGFQIEKNIADFERNPERRSFGFRFGRKRLLTFS